MKEVFFILVVAGLMFIDSTMTKILREIERQNALLEAVCVAKYDCRIEHEPKRGGAVMPENYDDHQTWTQQDTLHERWYSERGYEAELAKHPHCGDPDHPGCEHCNEPIGTPVRMQ